MLRTPLDRMRRYRDAHWRVPMVLWWPHMLFLTVLAFWLPIDGAIDHGLAGFAFGLIFPAILLARGLLGEWRNWRRVTPSAMRPPVAPRT